MSRPDVLPFCVSLRRRGWAPRSRGDCPAVCRQGQARRRVDLCASPAAQPPGGTAHGQAGKGTLVLAPSAGSTAETTVMARMKGRHMRLWMRTLALTAGIAALATAAITSGASADVIDDFRKRGKQIGRGSGWEKGGQYG